MNEWNQPRWESSLQGVGGDIGRPEHHQVLEGWRPGGAPAEASLDVNLDPSTNGWLVEYRDEELPTITATTGVASLTCQPWPVLPAHTMETPPILSRTSSPPFEVVTEARNLHGKQQLLPTERPRSPRNQQKSPASPKIRGVASSVIGEVSQDTMGGSVSPPHTGSTLEGERKSPTEKGQPVLQGRHVVIAPRITEGQSHQMAVSSPPAESSRNDRKSSVPSCSSEVRRGESSSTPSSSGRETTGRTVRTRSFSKMASHPAPCSLTTEKPAIRRVLRPKPEHRVRPQLLELSISRKATESPPLVVPVTKKQPSLCKAGKLDRKSSLSRQEISRVEPATDRPQKRRRQQLESVAARNSNDEDDGNDTDNQNLEARLMEWGFVRRVHLHCPCGMTFTRRWDARRHWVNSSTHKAERQRLGDFSDSTRFRCTKCKEVMSRKDSLRRHMASCGLRKKRRYRSGWNPNATSSEKTGLDDSGTVGADISCEISEFTSDTGFSWEVLRL